MSSVCESLSEHLTINALCRRYGMSSIGACHGQVTLTSVADALEDVSPGSLYISSTSQFDARIVHAAAKRGAYAVAFTLEDPAQMQAVPDDTEIPVLFAPLHNNDRAQIAADLAGHPSKNVAVFAVQGDHQGTVLMYLYDILHYLGNPLGVIDNRGGISLERNLHMELPLSPLDIQRVFAIMVEDGAMSVLIHIDDSVLEALSLADVDIDVYADTALETFNIPELETQHVFLNRKSKKTEEEEFRAVIQRNVQAYGIEIRHHTVCVEANDDAKNLVKEIFGTIDPSQLNDIATAVAMVQAAGVKRNSLKSALRMAREMKVENK